MSELILLRHGQSQWNLENRFTGWVDVPLSSKGEDEARAAGEKLRGRRVERLAGEPSYDAQLRAFVAAVREGTPFPTDPRDAVANMRAIDAIYAAAGRPRG